MRQFNILERLIFSSLVFIGVLTYLNLLFVFAGVTVTRLLLLIEVVILIILSYILGLLTAFLKGSWRASIKREEIIKRETLLLIILLISVVILNLCLLQYFKVVKWDGAAYLLNAQYYLGTDVLFTPYRHPFHPSLLSIGLLLFGETQRAIPFMTAIFLALAVYLLSLKLFENRVMAFASGFLACAMPLYTIWGLTFYAVVSSLVLAITALIGYLEYMDTKKTWAFLLFCLFASFAFLTWYSFFPLYFLLVYEYHRSKKVSSVVLGGTIIFATLLPYLIYNQIKFEDMLYSFKAFTKVELSQTLNVFPITYYWEKMDLIATKPLFVLAVLGYALSSFRKETKTTALSFFVLPFFFLACSHIVRDTRYLSPLIFIVPIYTTYLLHDILTRLRDSPEIEVAVVLVVIMGLSSSLILNFQEEVIPEYRVKCQEDYPLIKAAEYVKPLQGNLMSSSWILMSYYTQRYNHVLPHDSIDNLYYRINKTNTTFLITFERSGSPLYARDKTLLQKQPYLKLIKTFEGKCETAYVFQVEVP